MSFATKLIAQVVLNILALYIATVYFPGFMLSGDLWTYVIAAIVLVALNSFLRPVLKVVSAPFIWLSLGLFNVVINMTILWLADKILTQLTIENLVTLFWVSIILAVLNYFF